MSETIDQQDTDEALEPRALIEAVEQRNEDEVKRLIDAGVPVDGTDNRGKNALVEAVRRCNKTLVRLLVEEGKAFVDARDVYGRTPLFYAITKSKRIAKYLIEKGADVNLKDFSNRSPFSFFVENCMTNKNVSLSLLMSAKNDEVQMLTDPSKDVGHDMIKTVLSIIFCKLPLMCACQTESDIWTKPSTPKTRLVNQKTIKKTWKNFIPALIEARKHFAEKDTKKEAILGDILKKYEENKPFSTMCNSVIELLVKIGANPNFADSDGNIALHYAACLPWLGVSQETIKEICTLLHRFGVPLNAKNNLGQTPLLFCLSGTMRHLKEKDKVTAVKTLVEVCKFLITRGSSLKETTQDGESVFHLVIKLFQQGLEIPIQRISKDVFHQTVNILHCFSCDRLNEKTTVNKRDARLNSPLHYWATLSLPQDSDYGSNDSFGDNLEKVLVHLSKVGATPNPRNEDEKTPLHLCKTWKAVKLLIENGANPKDVESAGRSPLLTAAMNKAFVTKTGYFYPDVLEDPETFWKSVIEKGLDPLTTDEHHESVLSVLIKEKVYSLAIPLLKSYVSMHSEFISILTDNEGKSALSYAVQQSNNESVGRALIDAGADVNRTDNEGKTALLYAVQELVNESVVRALVDAGADVNRTDNEGKTALSYAVQQSNNESVVRALVDAGADLNARDHYGRTPLFYAITESDLLVTTCLLDRGANLNLDDSFSVLTFLFERLYEMPFEIHERIQILVKKKMVSKEQILKAISSFVFNKIFSFNPNSYDFIRDPLLGLLRVAKHYTTQVDGGQRKAIEKISKRIRDKQMEALFAPETIGIILRNLVELGANPNSVDSGGNSALHHVIQLSWRGVPALDVRYICNQLKEMGASLHIRNHQNETPVMHCLISTIKGISNGSFYRWSEVNTGLFLCQFLIEHESDVEEKMQNHVALELTEEQLRQVLSPKNLSIEDNIRLCSLYYGLNALKEKKGRKDNNGNTAHHLWAMLKEKTQHGRSARHLILKALWEALLDKELGKRDIWAMLAFLVLFFLFYWVSG